MFFTTGQEKEEVEAASHGEQRYNTGPIRAAFGTFSDPVKVYSEKNERAVGCVGEFCRAHCLAVQLCSPMLRADFIR